MADTHETHAEIIAECYHNTAATQYVRKLLDRLDAAHKREIDEVRKQVGDCAKLREALEYPKDTNDQYIHIGDAVHMLNTNHDGDHEWDDIVLSFEYVGKGGGDVWLVYGKDGAAWACECEVLKLEGGNDGK